MIDLGTTADRTRAVVARLTDEQLGARTPTGATVGELVQHLLGLCVAFRDAAGKVDGPTTSTPPGPVTDPLPGDWRVQADRLLTELAEAWRDPAAWEGMTRAGGVDLPGEIGGLVALDEVLLHGWDLAVATGQPYDPTDEECGAVLPVVSPEDDDPDGSGRGDLFGPVVAVPDDAPAFDRVLGLAGRDPRWTPGQ